MQTRCWCRGGGTNTKRCELICGKFGSVDMSYTQNVYVSEYIYRRDVDATSPCLNIAAVFRYIHIVCVWHTNLLHINSHRSASRWLNIAAVFRYIHIVCIRHGYTTKFTTYQFAPFYGSMPQHRVCIQIHTHCVCMKYQIFYISIRTVPRLDTSISRLCSYTHTSCLYDMATLPNLLHINSHRSAARCRGRIHFPSNFAENRHHEIHAGYMSPLIFPTRDTTSILQMSHVTHMNESHIYEWVMSHTWMSHATHMNESCHTHEWVMPHTWMRHDIHAATATSIWHRTAHFHFFPFFSIFVSSSYSSPLFLLTTKPHYKNERCGGRWRSQLLVLLSPPFIPPHYFVPV